MQRATMRITLAAVAIFLAAAPATAQDAGKTLPFRRGQWAAEFSATTSIPAEPASDDELRFAFPSVGFLRFLSPSKAILVDASFSVSSDEQELNIPNGPTSSEKVSSTALGLRAGLRGYRALSSRATGFGSLGLTFGTLGGTLEDPDLPDEVERSGTSFGGFAELGGAYMVTPNISLGASFGASLVRREVEETLQEASYTENGMRLLVGQTRLLVTLYF